MLRAILLLSLVGCSTTSGTTGPFVSDIRLRSGRLEVETCEITLTVKRRLNHVKRKLEHTNCSRSPLEGMP